MKVITKNGNSGFVNLPPKTACYVKNFSPLNGYYCKLSDTVFKGQLSKIGLIQKWLFHLYITLKIDF